MTLFMTHLRTLRDEKRGHLLYCSECDNRATLWGQGGTPYCAAHGFSTKWYMERQPTEREAEIEHNTRDSA